MRWRRISPIRRPAFGDSPSRRSPCGYWSQGFRVDGGRSVYSMEGNLTMRDEYSSHKGDPFAMFLYQRSLDGTWTDEETGDVQFAGWFGRIGRRIITEDSQGFVYCERYPTVLDAEVVFAEIAAENDDEADE